LFCYIIDFYSQDTYESTTGQDNILAKSSSSSSAILTIEIAVPVGVVALLALSLTVLLLLRRKNQYKHDEGIVPQEAKRMSNNVELVSTTAEPGSNYSSFSAGFLNYDLIKEEKELGKNIVKKHLIESVGSGAFGLVIKGTYQGKFVAIKKIKERLSEKQITEFLKEAELTKNIPPHPNVIRCIGVCLNPLCLGKNLLIIKSE
jgi:hypothetical protein